MAARTRTMSEDYKIEQVFESELTIDADVKLSRVFDTARLDHEIKFHHEDANDLRGEGCTPRRLRYRVVVYVEDITDE